MPSIKHLKTPQAIDERMNFLLLRVRRDSNELVELYAKRRKMVTGKIRVPAPPGKKHQIKVEFPGFDDAIDDIARRVAPGSCDPC